MAKVLPFFQAEKTSTQEPLRAGRVVIAEPQELVRLGLKLLLELARCKVVAEAVDGRQAIAFTNQFLPDLLLSDVELPLVHGFDVLDRLANGSVPVIMVTATDDEDMIDECLNRGAKGFILKISSFDELAVAIDAVLKGETYICREATRILMQSTRKKLCGNDRTMALSPRELIVIQLAARGKTNSEIGTALFISPRTAEAHRAHALKKLGVGSQTELVRYALKKHWIAP